MAEEKKMVKTYNKGECMELEADDLTAIIDMTVTSLKKHGGRPCVYEKSKEGMEKFIANTIEYFNYVNDTNANPDLEKKIVPDIENWAVYMGLTRQGIFKMEKRSDEWDMIIKNAKNAIASCKKQLAMTYKTPPMIAVFDLVNNHGYVNSNEFHLVPEPPKARGSLTSEINLEKTIEDSGLVWDEELGEYVPQGGK